MGLLLSHKRKLRLYGDMVVSFEKTEREVVGGGKRGEVQNFSAASRHRLFRELHQILFKTVTFVTLTYPAAWPDSPKVYKAHLKEFRRRFEVMYGKIGAIWRLEFQSRGAPHFHVMYFDCPFIPIHDLCWLWKCVTKTVDMAHELSGVDLKLITDGKQGKLIAKYVGKYISKVDTGTQNGTHDKVGRYWGKWNVETDPPIELETTCWEANDVITFCLDSRRGDPSWEPADRTKCTVFGDWLGSGFMRDVVSRYMEARGIIPNTRRD